MLDARSVKSYMRTVNSKTVSEGYRAPSDLSILFGERINPQNSSLLHG